MASFQKLTRFLVLANFNVKFARLERLGALYYDFYFREYESLNITFINRGEGISFGYFSFFDKEEDIPVSEILENEKIPLSIKKSILFNLDIFRK